MSEKHLAVEPHLPAANLAYISRLYEDAQLITLDGEIVSIPDADSDSLVAWMIAAKRMRDVARRMEELASSEMLLRCREVAGPISTEYGTAKESISRGSVTGVGAARIRDVLEQAAADDLIPWDAVENVAPLTAHVTPAKAAEYADAIETAHPDLADRIRTLLPEKRRTVKIDERVA
jgi:hypothetical protein